MARLWRRPWLLLLLAVVLGALAASWYVTNRGDTVETDDVPSVVGSQPNDAEPPLEDSGFSRQVTTTSGLQTTVPDTVGLNAATATFTLEEGGFRVRVMNRGVSDSSQDGIVVQQLIRGGVTRRLGSTVTIVVGRLR